MNPYRKDKMNFIKKGIFIILCFAVTSCNSDDDANLVSQEVFFRVDNKSSYLLEEVLIDNTEFIDVPPQAVSSYKVFANAGPPKNFPPSYFTISTSDENIKTSIVYDYASGPSIESGFYTLTVDVDTNNRININYYKDE